MSHAAHDAIGTALAQRIADGLSAHPEWIALACSNLDRWTRLNSNAPRLLTCYREWQAILELPVEQVIAVLRAPTDEGQRLRQNSPFAGALPPREVWDIKRQVYATIST